MQTGWLVVSSGAVMAAFIAGSVRAAEPFDPDPRDRPPAQLSPPEIKLPLDQLPPDARQKVQQVLDRPTLTVRGQAESFTCVPTTYHWLMDNPDRAVQIWKKLGARTVDIANQGAGVFGWGDNLGSELTWSTVYQTPRLRVFYASGQVRAGVLLPKVAVQAVVVVHYSEDGQVADRTTLRHQAEMAIHTDSKAIAAAARLLGASAQRLGEQYMGQLQMFYGALAWYLDQHPEQADGLIRVSASQP